MYKTEVSERRWKLTIQSLTLDKHLLSVCNEIFVVPPGFAICYLISVTFSDRYGALSDIKWQGFNYGHRDLLRPPSVLVCPYCATRAPLVYFKFRIIQA